MNYRHAFHAGNFADVLKHAVLARGIWRLSEKPEVLRDNDTLAGNCIYRLDESEAQCTGEWTGVICRVLGRVADLLPDAIRGLLSTYLDVVVAVNEIGRLS